MSEHLNHFRSVAENIAAKRCPHGFLIDPDQWDMFCKVVTERESASTFIPTKEYIVENKTNEAHETPRLIEAAETSTQERSGNAKLGGNIGGDLKEGAKAAMEGEYMRNLTKKQEAQQKWSEQKRHLPPQTRLEEKSGHRTVTQTRRYSCNINTIVNVYDKKLTKLGVLTGGVVGVGVGVGAGISLGSGVGGAVGVGVCVVGLGMGALASRETPKTISAKEIFEKFENFIETEKEVFCDIPISCGQ